MRVSNRPYGVSGPLSTHTEVKPRSGTSLESIKSLYGQNGNDVLDGGDGRDRLYGGNGNDTLRGGTGSGDRLEGNAGDDIYLFGAGDGNTTVYNYDRGEDRNDVLRFLEGIEASGVTATRNGDHLLLTVGSTGEVITVSYYFHGDATSGYQLDGIEFADGTVWDVDIVKGLVQQGSEGADTLYGSASDDTINGLGGNDRLYGAAGSDDTYLFGAGDGNTRVNNYDANAASVDTTQFEDVTIEDLWFSRSGNDLQITVSGTDDQVAISNWYSNSNYQVDRLETGSSVLLNSQVEQLVSAMASYSVPSGAGNGIPQDVKDELQPILVDTWQTT